MGFFQNLWADIENEWKKVFGGNAATVTAAIEADIKVIGAGLVGAISSFEAAVGTNSTALTSVQTLISNIEAASLQVVQGVETNLAQPVVTQIVNDFGTLVTTLKGFPIPVTVQNVLNAVTALLPYVEAAVGLLTAANSKASETVAASEATGLSRDDAYDILSEASHGAS